MISTLDRIRKYRETLADIQEIDIKVQELEEEMSEFNRQAKEEKIEANYKVTCDSGEVEKLEEKKEELYKLKANKKRELKRIENALTILTEEEREIVQVVHIEQRRYYVVQDKLNLSYQRIKQLEKQAAKKMERYIS
ncbi:MULTISPECIES: hypothetical protein [unclassified Clostridium]|uniref:hypothetical protein n=1 Tax=unclassified Clostridium TaxID=2614128 RepID=UPI000297D7B1|nr:MULTISPECIES: hypothetical protein [unclassified Clostridium]EKQ58315.1 MAG: hypothetical protein A370_00031 [Clostridium sp. Maddingley MBC34-26]